MALGRRQMLIGAAAAAFAAGGAIPLAAGDVTADAPTPDDMVLGRANARVTLIEYASTTCPHCAEFHRTVWDQLKANYIDTGKVRFALREFPTPPEMVAVAGFQVARCGGANAEQYMARVGVIFSQQHEIIASGNLEGVRQNLVRIGGEQGLSEAQVMACITDRGGAERDMRYIESAGPLNVTSTPTLFLNGRKLDPRPVTYEELAAVIDAELAQHS